MDTAMTRAALAIGRLDGLASCSSARDAWMVAAGLAGMRHILALDGVLLDQQQMAEGLCGILSGSFMQEVDRVAAGQLMGVGLRGLPLLPALLALFRVQQNRAPLLAALEHMAGPPPENSQSELPASAEFVAEGLEAVVSRLAAMLQPLQQMTRETAVLAAARVSCVAPAALTNAGVTAIALPCLTAVGPGDWLATSRDECRDRVLETLARQAEEGIHLHRQITSTCERWGADLGTRSGRQRSAMLSTILPAFPVISRTMLAAALQSTPRGAEKSVERWIRAGTLEWVRYGKEKMLRQCNDVGAAGRSKQWQDQGFASATADADAALGELDRLLKLAPGAETSPDTSNYDLPIRRRP